MLWGTMLNTHLRVTLLVGKRAGVFVSDLVGHWLTPALGCINFLALVTCHVLEQNNFMQLQKKPPVRRFKCWQLEVAKHAEELIAKGYEQSMAKFAAHTK